MTAATAPPLGRSIRLALLGPPAVWFVLFWIVYLGTEWSCRPGSGGTVGGHRVELALLGAVFTVGALVASAALVIGLHALGRHVGGHDELAAGSQAAGPDRQTGEDLGGNEVDLGLLAVVAVLVGGCSLLAIVAMAVPVLVLGPC